MARQKITKEPCWNDPPSCECTHCSSKASQTYRKSHLQERCPGHTPSTSHLIQVTAHQAVGLQRCGVCMHSSNGRSRHSCNLPCHHGLSEGADWTIIRNVSWPRGGGMGGGVLGRQFPTLPRVALWVLSARKIWTRPGLKSWDAQILRKACKASLRSIRKKSAL